MSDEGLFIGSTAEGARQAINWKRANRHGLIAGATGTGKTITLQVMAGLTVRAPIKNALMLRSPYDKKYAKPNGNRTTAASRRGASFS